MKRELEASETPESKRVKPDTREDLLECIRRQVLYYFSPKNLVHDKFFQDKMRETEERWLPIDCITSCKKVKDVEATPEDILEAIQGTSLIVREDRLAIRSEEPLPTYEPRKKREPRKPKERQQMRIHANGVLVCVTDAPSEVSWAEIKTALNEVHDHVSVNFIASPGADGRCFALLRPFAEDIQWVTENLKTVTLNGAQCNVTVVHDQMQAHEFFDVRLPAGLRKKLRPSNVPLNPIILGGQVFPSINDFRKNCREMLEVYAPGTEVKASALPVILDLLKYHPEPAKAQGAVSVKVEWHPESKENDKFKCFMLGKEDGSSESFSYTKCINNMAMDPPFEEKEKLETVTAEATPPTDEPNVETASV
ncbi:MAG: hypothetical protein KVP17_002546 [Porospora cf. gigantea B]|uniref:uncharacterized protein n=1 Tax=Porospora cf. gigantea B TaxID=2853592 RepID=UPI003571ACF5|nr:MAG: hypothetical protein KVP17_002546 [Porospora cf. gigantea B]